MRAKIQPRFWLVVLLAAAVSAGASAQQVTGSVEGVVSDASGAVLPGASVDLANVETGVGRTIVSGTDGRFAFNAVTPGTYELKVSLDGFKTVARRFVVEVNKPLRADTVLEIGSLSEVVEVSARSNPVDVARTQVSTNVDSRVVTDLPNLNRDITTLVELMPGARQAQGTTAGGSQVVDISGNYAQGDGTRRSQSVFYLDGSENMGGWRNQAMQMPNPDTVQEVQIVASSASAEFGKQPGLSMNVITKSGTNRFRGTAFFATHWEKLNANTWTTNANNGEKPNDEQRWMGGTLGGPVVRNRTFFFGSFQRFSDNNPGDQSSSRMPTQAMLGGDFSAIPGFSVKLTDPLTGQPIGAAIPQRLFNPIAQQLASRFPTVPAYTNDPQLGRLFWQFERPVDNNEYLIKIDHVLNDRNNLAVSYLTTDGDQVRPDNVSGLTNNVPDWGGNTTTGANQHTLSVRHTWQARSNLVVENRFAMGRLSSVRTRTELGENIETLGGVWGPVSPGVEQTLPTMIFSGGPTARGGQLSDLLQQNYRALSTGTWVRGKHTVKFGGEWQFNDYSRFINYDNGQVRFTGAYSNSGGPLNGPWPRLTNPSGDLQFAYAWADFLLGRVNSFNATGVVDNQFSGVAWFFFVQDQWQIGPRFTITPGLRYELYGTQQSKSLLAGYVAGHQSDQYSNAPLGLAFEGDAGIPDGMREAEYGNVAPRLGVAWDLRGNGRTVLRAGGGLYYAYPPLSIVEQLGSTVGASTITGNNAGLTDPWGTAHASSTDTACQFPGCTMPSFDPDPAKRTFVPTTVMGYDPDVTTPRQWQYNVTLQHELFRNFVLEGAYVGNRGFEGFSVRDNNLPLWTPTAGTGNVNARRPDQLWNGINLITTDLSEKYDAGQFSATYRTGANYARLTYVYQRYMTSATDQNREVGIDNSPDAWGANPRDIAGEFASVVPRQQVRGFFTYGLPSFSNRTTDLILGDWQLSGNFTWYDGDPLNVTLGRENNYDGITGDRPDQVGPINYIRTTEGTVTTWFDRSAFADPPAPSAANMYPFGTLPRNAVRGPGRTFLDAGVMKNFTLTGRYVFQFRVDINNILNHPNLSNPETNFSSADFGLIRTKTGGGRTMQVQFKLLF
jgi:hypothetical protein